jgi:coenzyme F420-reducing hydrogenase delta subunit
MIHLFYCANSMTEAELQDLQARFGANGLQTLSLPCSGKVTIPYLLKAFEKGADGVVVCSCPSSSLSLRAEGQTQCRQLEGNLRASKRAEAMDELIEEIGLGKGRVRMVAKEQGQIEKVIDGIQRLQTELGTPVRSVPLRASEARVAGFQPAEDAAKMAATQTPYGVTTSEVGRAAAAGTRSGDRLENAA